MEPLLARWPVTIELPVQWGDMDAFGHVNNVVYLRWFESARIEYARRCGMMARFESAGLGPILARQTIDYRIALQFPDTVRVGCTVLSIGRTSCVMGLRLRSRTNERAIAAEGEAVMVLFDYRKGVKVQYPDELRAGISALEATAADPGSAPGDA